MHDDATAGVPQETGALIDHILTNYHQMHRADLASLVPLAKRVEKVHADDPDAPKGRALALNRLSREMVDHMAKEEMILSPAMRAGGGAGIEHPIAVMRADHDDHASRRRLRQHCAEAVHVERAVVHRARRAQRGRRHA